MYPEGLQGNIGLYGKFNKYYVDTVRGILLDVHSFNLHWVYSRHMDGHDKGYRGMVLATDILHRHTVRYICGLGIFRTHTPCTII